MQTRHLLRYVLVRAAYSAPQDIVEQAAALVP